MKVSGKIWTQIMKPCYLENSSVIWWKKKVERKEKHVHISKCWKSWYQRKWEKNLKDFLLNW